jgi:hypothetical protein
VDGKLLPQSAFWPAGKLPGIDGTVGAARVPLQAGQHSIQAKQPFVATVHGWSVGTSYAYTAGVTW